MSEEELRRQLAEAQETIRTLQNELMETNREVMALTLDLEQRVEDLKALNSMASIVNQSLEVDELLNRAIEEALHIAGVDAAGILLLDEQAGDLELVAHRGISEAFVRTFSRMKLGEGLAGRVAQTGQPHLIRDLSEYPEARRLYVAQENLQSATSVPLVGRARTLGVMNLATSRKKYFDTDNLDLLLALGRQIATGLEKIRLHEETRAWAAELEKRVAERTADIGLVNALNQAANRGESLQEIIALLARESGRIFQSNEATVYLLSEDEAHLIMQNLRFSPESRGRIEKLIGRSIPRIAIPLQEGGLYWDTLRSKRSSLINDAGSIQQLITEFTEAVSLPKRAQRVLRKLVPRIYEFLEIRSVINVPLVSEGEAIGLLDISRHEPFTEADMERLATIAEQMTAIIKRKQAEEGLLAYSERLEEMVDERTHELRETQQRIEEALTLNRKIIGTSSLGITAYKASGECVLANASAAEIVGATREQLLAQNLRLIQSWRVAGLLEAAERSLDEREEVRKEVHIASSFGKNAWLDCRFVPFSLGGERHLLLVIDDITERKSWQERLIRHEKLATLGQLAGNVSHELRNPLGAIRNAVYFLRMALEDLNPEEQEALEIMELEIDRSTFIIKALLDFASAKPPSRSLVSINAILKECLLHIDDPEMIELTTRLDEDLPPALADRSQLVQVFDNLITNAIHAMPQGGCLLIESFEGASQRGEVVVSIGDTGMGIPKENLVKIFEPLFTTKAKGIGLGLPIVKLLVEGHGGTVEVESEVGKGTTFYVRLPCPSSLKVQP